MDQKPWLWGKRSSEKTIVAHGEEEQSVTNVREVELENSLKALNEQLASLLDECSAKDELVQNYEKMAEDATSDKHKAVEEVQRLKHELDEVQQQRAAANERLANLNSALKNSMEQLNQVRNEQEKIVNDAVSVTSKELEEKLSEANKRISSLTSESTYLNKALLMKEKLIEDLKNVKSETEAEFEALITRLDTVEKENAFLRYESRAVEKELELRNEELEYGRRSLEASKKQNSENVKKIKKLEGDCQRLRALTRKRLSGSSLSPNMRTDMELREINQRKVSVYSPEKNMDKKLGLLIDQLRDLERENGMLKEYLAMKEEEMEKSYHQGFKKLPFHEKFESNTASDQHSWASGYGIVDSNDIKNEPECKMIGASEMRLMDDFVEMEKLAIVAIDSSNETATHGEHMNSTAKAIVPVGPVYDWLHDVRKLILEQHSVSKRSIEELLGDIKMALEGIIRPEEPYKLLPISGYITWKSPSSSSQSSLVQESCNESRPSDVNRSIGKIIEFVGKFNPSHDEKIHVLGWKSGELTSVLQEFVCSCDKLLDGKINFEKFIGGLTSTVGWILDNQISHQDYSTVRDEFKKHLGGDGPGTAMKLESVQNLMVEMEKMHSISQVEIKGLKNELDFINSEALMHDKLRSLTNEMEILRESKRADEERIESLIVIKEDLNTQLTVSRAKLNEVVQKLSSVEVELDNKTHCCQELEGTCLELQLQLESIVSNQSSEVKDNQEGLLRTGLEITKASARLAECEESIFQLGNQLKSLDSSKQLSTVDKVMSIIGTNNNKKFIKQRSSLLDQMLSEDDTKVKKLTIKEETSKNSHAGALVVVPSRKRGGGFGLLRKLLLRRKKSSSKNTLIYFGK